MPQINIKRWIYIAKSKKPKRKWNKAHFFQRKKSSRRKVGHPALIYATSNEDYRYLTFTHKIEKGNEGKYEKLIRNIDKNDTSPCYVKKKFDEGHYSLFEDPVKKYEIDSRDKKLIKKYKKY